MSTYLNYSIDTREEFKQWILRKLGAPLITIELTDEQLDDCINDSVETYTKYCLQDEDYYAFQLSGYTETSGFLMPSNVLNVFSLDDDYNYNNTNGINTLFSISNAMWNAGIFPNFMGGEGWISYHLARQSVELSKRMTGGGFQFHYNPRTKYLKLYPDPIAMDMSGLIVVGCSLIRAETMQLGEDWVKRMALAEAKILLGTIRKKFEGVQLLGGGTIDTTIGDEGTTERDALIEKLRREEGPSFNFFMG